MTGILKASVQCRIDDAALRVTECVFGALDSLQEYVLVRSTARAQLIDRTLGENEGCAGICAEFEYLPPCQDFIPDRAFQHDVHEILEMLVSGYAACWSVVVLENDPRPVRGMTRQFGRSMEEGLDPPLSAHLDAGLDGGEDTRSNRSRLVFCCYPIRTARGRVFARFAPDLARTPLRNVH